MITHRRCLVWRQGFQERGNSIVNVKQILHASCAGPRRKRGVPCRHEKEGSIYQDQGTLNREDPKTQSLPANLLRSSCSASSLDLDAQLLRLRMLFDAHSLYKADPTGAALDSAGQAQKHA